MPPPTFRELKDIQVIAIYAYVTRSRCVLMATSNWTHKEKRFFIVAKLRTSQLIQTEENRHASGAKVTTHFTFRREHTTEPAQEKQKTKKQVHSYVSLKSTSCSHIPDMQIPSSLCTRA